MSLIFNMLNSVIDDINGCGSFILVLIILFAIWIGFTFFGVWLWGVIAVQIFGLPSLTFWQFFGLEMLLDLLLPHSNGTSKEDK